MFFLFNFFFLLIIIFDFQGNPVNNLSPVVGTSDHLVKFEEKEISEESLNIKINNERIFTETLFDKNTDHNTKSPSNETLEIFEASVSDRPHHFHNHSFSGLHW